MKLANFISLLTVYLKQKQVRENCNNLIYKIISKMNSQLWALSESHNEYNNFHNMLSGSLKTTVNTEKINLALLAGQSDYFRSKDFHIIVHDPSSIRKPESQNAEYLCQVKDLDNKIVNGYMTYNCIAVDLKANPIHLLRCIPYSTEQPEYVTQAELQQVAHKTMTDRIRAKKIKDFTEQGTAFNLRTLTFDAIKTITAQILKENPNAIIIDVFDRGFDSSPLFEYETEQGNSFVVRLKLNRNSNEIILDIDGVEQAVKLKNQNFNSAHEKIFAKIHFKDTLYTNVKGIFEWNKLVIKQKTYSVVRISFFESNGKKIFDEPMLLITNILVDDETMAMLVFEIYMTRSKIEGVFKFCKTNLGWEKIQIPVFEAIKNLLSLVFFVAGYFYEIEDEMTKDTTLIWLAKLGGGKGKVTKNYILRGLAMLINYRIAQQYIKEHNISEELIDIILKTCKSNK